MTGAVSRSPNRAPTYLEGGVYMPGSMALKVLTAAYVTHAHADHFFGLGPVLEGFPYARLVTHADVVRPAAEQADPEALARWHSFFPGQIADHPVTPTALLGDELQVEGQSLKCLLVGQSDVEQSTVVHVPELDAVVAGDVAYNRVHMWLAGSDPKARAAWIESLNAIERLRPETVIAGHKDPDAPDDVAARVLDESRQYIRDFDEIVEVSDSAQEIVAKMLARPGQPVHTDVRRRLPTAPGVTT
ncbi:MBL fold metallo-hydrolase [Kribbella sp. VKM Ac-2500]|nr:MBL fold metallo-hydrolase [Kribbella sp. VKM Ac-2500]